jgi:hypothetical protein
MRASGLEASGAISGGPRGKELSLGLGVPVGRSPGGDRGTESTESGKELAPRSRAGNKIAPSPKASPTNLPSRILSARHFGTRPQVPGPRPTRRRLSSRCRPVWPPPGPSESAPVAPAVLALHVPYRSPPHGPVHAQGRFVDLVRRAKIVISYEYRLPARPLATTARTSWLERIPRSSICRSFCLCTRLLGFVRECDSRTELEGGRREDDTPRHLVYGASHRSCGCFVGPAHA